MNEQTPSAAVAQAREAKAERLFKAILGRMPDNAVSDLWAHARFRTARPFDKDLRTIIFAAYDAGYDDGFAEGEAIANEPDRNEGYE
jgi:hypothetical protein